MDCQRLLLRRPDAACADGRPGGDDAVRSCTSLHVGVANTLRRWSSESSNGAGLTGLSARGGANEHRDAAFSLGAGQLLRRGGTAGSSKRSTVLQGRPELIDVTGPTNAKSIA